MPTNQLIGLLEEAESFIAGFEGDETQEESVDGLLARIRAAIAQGAPSARVLITVNGGIAEFERHGPVDVDILDFDDLKETHNREERDAIYKGMHRWVETGELPPDDEED